ncbi:phosphatidylinositide phosphatase sac2, partial [Plakobranchus ocellatus]
MEPAMFKSRYQVLRLIYHHLADEGLFHVFRVPSTRLFNNRATTVQSAEEVRGQLHLLVLALLVVVLLVARMMILIM